MAATHHVSDVIDDNGGLCSSVVHGSQTVVSLLSCCVPDLKLDCRIIQVDRLSQEGSCMEVTEGVRGREGEEERGWGGKRDIERERVK